VEMMMKENEEYRKDVMELLKLKKNEVEKIVKRIMKKEKKVNEKKDIKRVNVIIEEKSC
jgi:exopolyphosphatase/pppGpp-phosphohydrolase